MAQNEIRTPRRQVIEHWEGGVLLSRHWADQSAGCSICSSHTHPGLGSQTIVKPELEPASEPAIESTGLEKAP